MNIVQYINPTGRKTGRGYYLGVKVTDRWIYDFAKLLKSIGVEIGKISPCPLNKPGHKRPVRFHIKFRVGRTLDATSRSAGSKSASMNGSRQNHILNAHTIRAADLKRLCTIEGCDKRHLARGYCSLRYYRFVESPITGRKGVK
jgi:hypothetical protein